MEKFKLVKSIGMIDQGAISAGVSSSLFKKIYYSVAEKVSSMYTIESLPGHAGTNVAGNFHSGIKCDCNTLMIFLFVQEPGARESGGGGGHPRGG